MALSYCQILSRGWRISTSAHPFTYPKLNVGLSKRLAIGALQFLDIALLPGWPLGRKLANKRAELLLRPFIDTQESFHLLEKAKLTVDVDYFLARLLRYKYDYCDDLPLERIEIDSSGYQLFKCRLKSIFGIRNLLMDISQFNIIGDRSLPRVINIFLKHIFNCDSDLFTTKEEIRLINDILDFSIIKLEPYSNSDTTNKYLELFRSSHSS
ncbi:MAG: hypothetical protein PHH14_05975 [Candidatus Margulisbacteria bacterium]|nr:hypothetical protein [Candidatus Margulisiibacteriota bacterium]